jgi:hypothetical protein
MEVHIAEPLVLGPCRLEVKIAIVELGCIYHQVVIIYRQN